MSGGEGVRNPADLTPVLDELDDIDSQLDDIEAALAVIDGIVDDILVDTIAIIAALIVIDDEIEDIQDDVTLIRAVTDGLPTLTETGTTVTTTVLNTEYNIYVNAAPFGVFNPICVKIDCSEQAGGDTIIIRQYSQGEAGVPAPVLEDELEFAGVISPPKIIVDLDPNRFGIWVTIERTGGAARTYIGEPFYEI